MLVECLTELFVVKDGIVTLVGSHCLRCGSSWFPRRVVCAECGCRTLEVHRLTGCGNVHAWTYVAAPPSGFAEPYFVGVIDLEEGPRIFGLLTRPPEEGEKVQAVQGRVRDGEAGFVFEPVNPLQLAEPE